ncbi:MAG TPA: hypothetical protein VIX82_11790 [Solirubrobacteraceae bacterium]
MKLAKVTIFAAGYVIGTRAGRERYAQIVEGIAKVSARLEEFSSHRPPGGNHRRGSGRADRRS